MFCNNVDTESIDYFTLAIGYLKIQVGCFLKKYLKEVEIYYFSISIFLFCRLSTHFTLQVYISKTIFFFISFIQTVPREPFPLRYMRD